MFDEVRVLGDSIKTYLDESALVPMTDKRISVRVLPPNTSPSQFKNDKEVESALREEIAQADAILIKPSTRKGMMAEEICNKMRKPYMIEMTGDIHNALMQSPSVLKRMYAPYLYWQIKRHMRHYKFGLYVSKEYLQSQYPIDGLMCGCADVILDFKDETVMERRMKRIETLQERDTVEVALIGFYQGTLKGVDTGIRALSHLPEKFHLNILGNGTEENRQKWYDYGKSMGVVGRIKFAPHYSGRCAEVA